MIIGVVVTYGDLHICLPKPNRYNDCILYANKVLGLKDFKYQVPSTSGFYLSDGTFLNRADALEYAKSLNQLINKQAHTQLFSEDLW